MKEFSCAGKVALVTGGGAGIGKGIAIALAEAGANVVIAGRTASTLEGTTREIVAMGRKCLPVVADVSLPDRVEHLVSAAVREMGKVDILVSNAGLNILKPVVPLPQTDPERQQAVPEEFLTVTSDEQWHQVVDTNLSAAFYLVRALGPHLLERREGKVVIVSSIGGLVGKSHEIGYGASKAGLIGMVRCLAREWGRYNINVNCIAPGFIATEMSQRILEDKKLLDRRLQKLALKKIGKPRDIAMAAVFLASAASDYITGQTIVVDGGEIV